ncbi:tetratricopeptide repeat protein [Aureivirga sp. CE67]|uniref:tetratricopeptide repeat protein n=1 Tax=Aureivirga sp. CE67 TaxID=1788983 RepID=UPI0018CA0723|nr:tetratricopeptide repeat protein [Aureivirga sp. CE67]
MINKRKIVFDAKDLKSLMIGKFKRVINQINNELNYDFKENKDYGIINTKIAIKVYEDIKIKIHFIKLYKYGLGYVVLHSEDNNSIDKIEAIINNNIPILHTTKLFNNINLKLNCKNLMSLAIHFSGSAFNEEVFDIVSKALQSNDDELLIGALDAVLALEWDELYTPVLNLYQGSDTTEIKEKAISVLETYKGENWVLDDIPKLEKLKVMSEEQIIELATKYKENEKYEQAIRIISEYSGYQQNEHMTLKLGQIYNLQSQFDKAKDYFDQAINLDADLAEAYFERGTIVINTNPKNAIRNLEKALSLQPDYYEALLNLGIAYYNNSESTKAIEVFDKLISEKPYDNAYYCRGNVYYSIKDYDQAKEDYLKSESLLKISPSGSISAEYIYQNLGLVEKAKENYNEAIIYFDKSIEANPKFARAYMNKGLILLILNKVEEAGENLENSVNYSNGHDTQILFVYGVFVFNQEEFDEAEVYFEKVLKINPNHEQAQKYLEIARIKIEEEYFN